MTVLAKKTPDKQQRWLRYEFARLAAWRNLLIAAIIALCVVGIVLAVAYFTGGMPKQIGNTALGEAKAGKSQGNYDLAGDRLIPSTPEIHEKINKFLVDNGVLEGFTLSDVQEATGYSVSNVVYVERGKGWDHAVAIMPEDKLYHIYTFTYSCGHTASVSPDPYRDLMFAEPEKIALEYAGKLCSDGTSMRQHLDAKPAASKPEGS
jgi:hypothetical protein